MSKRVTLLLKQSYEFVTIIFLTLAVMETAKNFMSNHSEPSANTLAHGITFLFVTGFILGHLLLSMQRTKFQLMMPIVAFFSLTPLVILCPVLIAAMLKGFPPASHFERGMSYITCVPLLLILSGIPIAGLFFLYRLTRHSTCAYQNNRM